MILQHTELSKKQLLQKKYKRSEVDLIIKTQDYFKKLNHNFETAVNKPNYSIKRVYFAVNYFASRSYNYEIICGAFLAHCLHYKAINIDSIINNFGPKLYALATSVYNTEVSESKFFDYIEISEVVKSLLNDQRIWLIKLMYRYFDIVNVNSIQDLNIQRNIVTQTRDVYLTIADVLQERALKEELEDMIFEYLEPSVRSIIVERLSYVKTNNSNIVSLYSKKIQKLLMQNMIFADVKGRIKRPYSIWKKMQLKSHSFEGINDLLAFRVIVGNTKKCYKSLGILHSHFAAVNTMFKDYISHPKVNGYQSIHTGLLTKDDEIFEVQIRTKQMDTEANYGNSSHWVYKSGKQELSKNYVRQINNLMSKNVAGRGYFSYENKISEGSKINVFTPTKSPVVLPKGSTPLDFAYSIHTDLGNTFDYSEVNGDKVEINYKLQEGDIVNIFTSKNNKPQAKWLNSCITSSARSEIKKFLRTQKDLSNKEKAEAVISYLAEQAYGNNKEYSVAALIEKISSAYNTQNFSTLYGNLLSYDISHLSVLGDIFKVNYYEDRIPSSYIYSHKDDEKDKFYTSRCCYAMPDDEIVAVAVSKSNSYMVHSTTCKIYNKYKDVLHQHKVDWSTSRQTIHKSRIFITVLEENSDNIYKIFKLIEFLNSKVVKSEITFNATKGQYFIDIIVTIQSRSRFKELCLNIYRKCAVNSLTTPNNSYDIGF